MGLWALGFVRRRRTRPIPFKSPTALVAKGPCRGSRHPRCVEMVLIWRGIAVLCGVTWALALARGRTSGQNARPRFTGDSAG